MKCIWTIICLTDVPQSVKWNQLLSGMTATAPSYDCFGQIVDSNGTVLLSLHEQGSREHPR
jgi:hypothetical protein